VSPENAFDSDTAVRLIEASGERWRRTAGEDAEAKLRALEVDGFETDATGRPIGCTITLVFSGGSAVRLGASRGTDRTALAPLLPALLRRVGA